MTETNSDTPSSDPSSTTSNASNDSSEKKAATLLIAAGALVGVVVFIILVWFTPWWLAILLALAAGVAVMAWVQRSADSMVLKKAGAKPLAASTAPLVHNLVDGLSINHGFSRPELFVIEDKALNALVVGRTAETSKIAITQGLMDTLTTIEIEGVLAHLLSKVASGDTLLATRVAVLVGTPLAPFGGLARSVGARFLGTQRSVLADMEGVRMTRYPPGLVHALEKMAADGRAVANDTLALRHLWVDMPEGSLVPAEFALRDRIALLYEL